MSTYDLLKDIEKKDRRFRIARAIFNTVLLGSTLASLIIGLTILRHVQAQQDQLTKSVEELKQSNTAELQRANKHIDCIALFFATPNRLNKTLDGCDVQAITPPLAPQASSSVNSKTVTVSSAPQPGPSQPQSKSGLQQTEDTVNKVLNNFGRSL